MKRMWAGLSLEERILNAAVIISLASVFFPWLSGEWPGGDTIGYSGFGFYTSFIGIVVFLCLLIILLMTALPFFGGPVLFRRKHRENVRFFLALQVTILLLAALSVLTKVTYEFSRIEIRYGIYVTLIGSIIVTIYAFLRWQEEKKTETHDLFHHPEDMHPLNERQELNLHTPPPPPPPPPLEPEELHIRA